jgi:hypothetical protein
MFNMDTIFFCLDIFNTWLVGWISDCGTHGYQRSTALLTYVSFGSWDRFSMYSLRKGIDWCSQKWNHDWNSSFWSRTTWSFFPIQWLTLVVVSHTEMPKSNFCNTECMQSHLWEDIVMSETKLSWVWFPVYHLSSFVIK